LRSPSTARGGPLGGVVVEVDVVVESDVVVASVEDVVAIGAVVVVVAGAPLPPHEANTTVSPVTHSAGRRMVRLMVHLPNDSRSRRRTLLLGASPRG